MRLTGTSLRRRLTLLAALVGVVPAMAEVEVGGFVETNHFVGLVYGDLFDYGNTNILGLRLSAEPGSQVKAVGAFELRNTNFLEANTSSDLGRRDRVEPLYLRIDEAYIDLYGIGFEDLDVRIGKQHLVWGSGDGFNPTAGLAPYDLENPLDFRNKLGVAAINATYYFPWDMRASVSVVPLFTPSLVPVDLFAADVEVPFELPDYVELGELREVVESPVPQVRSTQFAARLAGTLYGVDLAATYFYGYQTIPVLTGVDVYDIDLSESPWRANVEARIGYPRTQSLGLDVATSVAGIGLWAEAALFLPEPLTAEITIGGVPEDPLTGDPIPPIEVIDDTPYVKAVMGADYTAPGGWYFNLQWVHGFFHELSAEQQQDYAFLAVRKTLFDEELEIQLSLGGEMDDSDHLAAMAGLEIAWIPFDATRLTVGGLLARGDEGTTLSGFEKLDQVYLRFRADF